MVSLPGFEPGPPGPKPGTLPDYATERLFGAAGETRTRKSMVSKTIRCTRFH